MAAPMFDGGRLDSVQMLRGMAAMLIVLGHATVVRGASAGVELFFCVSGFIMMYVTQGGAKGFLLKRAVRVAPLYWAATLLKWALGAAGLMGYRNPDALYAIRSLLFLTVGEMPLLTQGWTLVYEAGFYLLFFAACKINLKYRAVTACALLVGWTALAAELRGHFGVQMEAYFVTMPLSFVFGIALFYAIKAAYANKTRLAGTGGVCLVVMAVCVLTRVSNAYEPFVYAHGAFTMARPLANGLPAALFALSFCVLTMNGGGAPLRRALVYLGNISYSLYLFHVFVLQLLKWALTSLNLFGNDHQYMAVTIPNLCFTLLVAAGSVGVAAVMYELVELRFTRLLRRALRL